MGNGDDLIPNQDVDRWIRFLVACRALTVDERRAAWPLPRAAPTWLARGRPQRRAPR